MEKIKWVVHEQVDVPFFCPRYIIRVWQTVDGIKTSRSEEYSAWTKAGAIEKAKKKAFRLHKQLNVAPKEIRTVSHGTIPL